MPSDERISPNHFTKCVSIINAIYSGRKKSEEETYVFISYLSARL